MCDSVTSASRGSSATIGRKRDADDVLPGTPQKRLALEDGCLVFKDRTRFTNICSDPSGTLVALGTVGIKSERRVLAVRSTDRGDRLQAPVTWLTESMAAACLKTPALAA